MFFDMSFQENVKNVIKTRFLNFEKNVKYVFWNNEINLQGQGLSTQDQELT